MMNPQLFVTRWHSPKGRQLASEFTDALQNIDPDQAVEALSNLSLRHEQSSTIVRTPDIDVRGIQLSNLTIKELDLQRADLSFSCFAGCRFVNLDFQNADFGYCRFNDCVFENCTLDSTNMQYAQFNACSLINSSLQQLADLSFSHWIGCTFDSSSVYVQTKNALFDQCTFSELTFRAKGGSVEFTHCRFNNLIFEEFSGSASLQFYNSDDPQIKVAPSEA